MPLKPRKPRAAFYHKKPEAKYFGERHGRPAAHAEYGITRLRRNPAHAGEAERFLDDNHRPQELHQGLAKVITSLPEGVTALYVTQGSKKIAFTRSRDNNKIEMLPQEIRVSRGRETKFYGQKLTYDRGDDGVFRLRYTITRNGRKVFLP